MGEERAARLTWLGAWASLIKDAPPEVLESCTVRELHGKARCVSEPEACVPPLPTCRPPNVPTSRQSHLETSPLS